MITESQKLKNSITEAIASETKEELEVATYWDSHDRTTFRLIWEPTQQLFYLGPEPFMDKDVYEVRGIDQFFNVLIKKKNFDNIDLLANEVVLTWEKMISHAIKAGEVRYSRADIEQIYLAVGGKLENNIVATWEHEYEDDEYEYVIPHFIEWDPVNKILGTYYEPKENVIELKASFGFKKNVPLKQQIVDAVLWYNQQS